MTGGQSHLVLLRNAARQTASGLTAVEVDTEWRAADLVKTLSAELGKRPFEKIPIRVSEGASALLAACRRASRQWPPEEGVLFVVDGQNQDEDAARRFWIEMNGLRESWGALDCHVIFFLLPASYRMLVRAADHLADWMPVKLHITHSEKIPFSAEHRTADASVLSGDMSPQTARRQLSALQSQLATELQKGTPDGLLIRRYYLPMLEAAVAVNDLHRAKALRKKISETDVSRADLVQWLSLNFNIDMESRRLDQARDWAEKLLKRSREIKNRIWEVDAYHKLGRIAEERRDFETAEKWYRKSLEISEKHGNDHDASLTYGQLGRIAEERRDFETAEKWYRKSLEISEKHGNDHDASLTYGQLGRIAEERRDFETAEKWYRKSLEISEKHGDDHVASLTYHQLGIIALERRDFEAAEKWYRKSLEISEKHGNEHVASFTYHQLGMIAQERRDFETAEKWYRKSLEIKEKHGNEHGAAITYGQLGIVAGLQARFEESGRWLIKAAITLADCNDPEGFRRQIGNFRIFHGRADAETRSRLETMLNEAGLPNLDEIA